jgi:hypothetical protein
MKILSLIAVLAISSMLTVNMAKAQNAQKGKEILVKVGIELLKSAYLGTNVNPVTFAVKAFLQSKSVVDDATEMAQIKSIQQLEAQMIRNGLSPDEFYRKLDQYLAQNSSSLCDDPVYKNFYKCE